MGIKNKIKNRNKYFFISLVLIICVLGSIFGVTFAYFSGVFDKSSDTNNPFVDAKVYIGANELTNEITGTIDGSGNVKLTIGATEITATNGVLDLDLYVGNAGNIDADISMITAYFEFFNSDDTFNGAIQNQSGADTYYLTLNVPTGIYTLEYNEVYNFTEANLAKNTTGTSGSKILDAITVDSTKIVNSNLLNKKFKLHFWIAIAQEGIEDLIEIET